MTSLGERLGLGDDGRAVIIGCGALGESHAATTGTYDALRGPIATTASLLVPCPWARDAAARFRGEDVGVQLTLNAEHELYRWGPITHAPSLLDGNGGFPVTVADLWDHADLEEVRRECRAQLERAVFWGFDVTHLDSHLDVLALRPEFFDVYLDLAVEFALPIHLPGPEAERRAGFPFRHLAAEEGVLFADHVVEVASGAADAIERALYELEPGVTELRLHPAIDTPELRALDPSWSVSVEHHQALLDARLAALLGKVGAERIGYWRLRELQRS